MRVNVWLPDQLVGTVRDRLPGLNISRVLQDALRERLGCRHERVVCADCALPFDVHGHTDAALDRFYLDVIDAVERLMVAGGTIEGAARVTREVALRWRLPSAAHRPLPRRTRAERIAAKVRPITEAMR